MGSRLGLVWARLFGLGDLDFGWFRVRYALGIGLFGYWVREFGLGLLCLGLLG